MISKYNIPFIQDLSSKTSYIKLLGKVVFYHFKYHFASTFCPAETLEGSALDRTEASAPPSDCYRPHHSRSCATFAKSQGSLLFQMINLGLLSSLRWLWIFFWTYFFDWCVFEVSKNQCGVKPFGSSHSWRNRQKKESENISQKAKQTFIPYRIEHGPLRNKCLEDILKKGAVPGKSATCRLMKSCFHCKLHHTIRTNQHVAGVQYMFVVTLNLL